MQAIILAAGFGKRLKDLTKDNTKCMVKVNGETIIERMLKQLDSLDLSRIIIVVGYKGEKLKEYVRELNSETPLIFIENEIYDRTNNIYSLYLARKYLVEEDTLLLESDLIFEDSVVNILVENEEPSLAVVAKYESWMDGTIVRLSKRGTVESMSSTKEVCLSEEEAIYKTVNIYKFSQDFSRKHYVPFLEAYCVALGNNENYEQVLKVIALLDEPGIKALVLDDQKWYEIDDAQDLDIAKCLFASSPKEALKKMERRYGGYWRYSKLLDFCYLANPFFPTPRMQDEMKSNFQQIIGRYPSGMEVNSLLAAKYYGLDNAQVAVGNGAAELIKSLFDIITGSVGVIYPTFDEYVAKIGSQRVVPYFCQHDDYSYTSSDLIEFFEDKRIGSLVLINPDNPSGNFIGRKEIRELLIWCQKKHIRLIIDESFVDFVDAKGEFSLLVKELIEEYAELIIIKSISKSFGVPGIRLGILASGDLQLISEIKRNIPIWNINSFGEIFLQIWGKYRKEYLASLQTYMQVKEEFIEELSEVSGLRAMPSLANFLMCEITNGLKARELAEILLCEHNIFIKDLTKKIGIKGEYIRLAVLNRQDNRKLVSALKKVMHR